PYGCRGHALDHVAQSVGKAHIIFEKSTMCQDMCNNQLILDQTIRNKQTSIAWVGIDDELVNLAQPEVIMQFHFMELLTKTPMGKPCWHAICSKCINDISRAYFIPHRIKIKAESGRYFRDFIRSEERRVGKEGSTW